MTRRQALGAGLAGFLALGTACGADDGEPPPGDTRAPVVDTTEPSSPTTTVQELDPVESVTGVEIGLETVVEVEAPSAMAFRPGVEDEVYVGQRPGVVLALDLESGDTTAVLDISDETTTDNERGLLGLAVSPDGERLYLSSTNLDGASRIDEYAVARDGSIDADSRRAVFLLDQPFANHNGGHVAFGPDGLLYVGLGDGGSSGDPLRSGQDRGQFFASVLRIDPQGADGSAYGIPADNPFVGEDGARPEVWLTGVRNPWRFSFDRATGDLWLADVGQDDVEEVNHLPAEDDGEGAGRGANLGWSAMEGDQPFAGGTEPDDHTPPVFTYPNPEAGCSVTGGYVYRGAAVPELFGAYLYSDYCAGEIRALAVPEGTVVDDATVSTEAVPEVVSFAEAPDGELFVLSLQGAILRIVPT